MAVGDVQPTSFEFYEGIRILVPGALVVGLYQAVIGTFDVAAPEPKSDTLGALVAALAAGLVLYFVDAPAKSAYFLKDPPDAELEGIERPGKVGRLNLYFVLLDQGIPAGIRARALYMGSMYRIGYEVIHLLALTALGVLVVASLAEVGRKVPAEVDPDARLILLVAAAVQLLVLWVGIRFDAARTGNPRYKGRDEHRLSDIPNEVGLAGLLALLGAALAIASIPCEAIPREFAAGGVVIAGGAWARRYFRGFDGAKRKPIGRSAASCLFCLCFVPALLLAAVPDDAATELSDGLAVGWGGLVIVAHVLLISRGHEKRLGGSYATQRTWIALTHPELKQAIETGTLTRIIGSLSEEPGAPKNVDGQAAGGEGEKPVEPGSEGKNSGETNESGEQPL